MTTLGNLLDEAGVPLRYPTEYEERRSGLMSGKQLQDLAGVGRHSAFKCSPVPTTDRGIKSRNLKMFFNIECEAMQCRVPHV